ncbi:MAG: imidazoleglycerol-phosphate dehydratase HisB [Nitrospirota bacterium]
MTRKASLERKTKETDIKVELKIDGNGKYDVKTGIPFLDHMFSLFSRHGLFDLRLRAKGDTEVDYHHTVEDIGIILGDTIKKALGDKRGIKRYGEASIPMDETLAMVSLDISGRPYLIYNVKLPRKVKLKDFDPGLVEDFFRALVNHAGITLHINLFYGRDAHHILEAIFKAFGRALDQATMIDPRNKGVPSTKGRL